MKKYTIAIETIQCVEVEAANEETAVAILKARLDPHTSESARFQIVTESAFDTESNTYKPL